MALRTTTTTTSMSKSKPKAPVILTINLAELKSMQETFPAPEGEGWETSADIAKREGYSQKHTADLLKLGLTAGVIEMKKFTRGGRRVEHYRRIPA